MKKARHFRTVVDSVKTGGLRQTGRRGVMWFGQRVLGVRPDITQHRYVLSERICQEFDFTVRYGPLAGLRLNPESWWSAADRGAMILGLYEMQVLQELAEFCDGTRPLVDVGAADGYYAIGAVRAGLAPRALCFEATSEGQDVIRANAAANDVADRIEILGTADKGFLDQIPDDYWNESQASVFLFDVEGGEFDLLTDEVLFQLRNSFVIVELHEPIGDRDSKAAALIERANRQFATRLVGTGPRDPSSISALEAWSDDDRWLLMSESPAFDMRWLFMEPRQDDQASQD